MDGKIAYIARKFLVLSSSSPSEFIMEKTHVSLGRPRVGLQEATERLRPGLPLVMNRAVRYGVGHAKRVLIEHGNRFDVGAPEEGFIKLLTKHSGYANRKALYAAYLHGAVLIARKLALVSAEADEMRGLWGAMLQRELVELLLAMRPDEHCDLRAWWKQMDVDRFEWVNHTGGALAVARVTYALLRLHAHVYFPFPDEDMEGKIDLIVDFPGQQAGVCLQIKGDGAVGTTTINMLSGRVDPEHRHFAHGVMSFTARVLGEWKAAVAFVGLQGLAGSRLHECEAVRTTVGEFVSRTFPNYSVVDAARAG